MDGWNSSALRELSAERTRRLEALIEPQIFCSSIKVTLRCLIMIRVGLKGKRQSARSKSDMRIGGCWGTGRLIVGNGCDY